MLPRALLSGAIGGLCALAVAAGAHATVLTFDPVPGNSALVLQGYGDRVTSTDQNGFQYGADLGFTPNVVVEYRPNLRYRTTGMGDLVNSLYREDSGNRLLEINLSADLGYQVCLHYFDLAAQIGEALTVKSVQVTTGQLEVLYRADWVLIPDIVEPRPLPAGESGTPTHLRFAFDPAICNSPALKIRIELDNLGFKVPRIGIDNIGFSQTPAPSAATLFLTAGGLLGARRRRPWA
jgi:hypothetical protein